MKKLFISVLAIAGLVACTQEQTLVQQGPAPMEFGGAFVKNATRANAAVDPSTTTESITGFDVWGFMDEPKGVVFEGEDVTGEKGNFTYVNTQYWLPGHDYYFAALAPMNSANWTLNTEAANTFGAGIVDFHNVDGTEDLLYAAKMVSTKGLEVGQAPEDGVVKLQFSHLLSKVKFTFTNGFDNANAYIDVKEVTMEVPAFASINLAQEDWWSTNQWALAEGKTTLAFGDACAKTAMGVKQETANERLTIPAGADQEYKVTFKVQLYFGDVAAFENVQTLESVVKGVALEMGKAYNFTAEINASNISEDGKELLPIVFDVEEVKDWVYAGEDEGQIEDAELRAALQLGGEVTLQKDYTLTESLIVPAGVTSVINLNGHNIINATDSEELGEGDGIVVYGNLTINGNGTVQGKTRSVWARGNDNPTVTINGGNYVGAVGGSQCEVIYASGNGVITINGGTFEAETEDKVSFAAPQYAVLNIHGNGATGCDIVVYGGSFKNFDPANNISENPAKNFCAPGYFSTKIGDNYVVADAHLVATAEDLQAALNEGVEDIRFAANIKGDVVVSQTEGVNYVIDGAGYKFDGTLGICGNARSMGTETLTIKNVAFETAATSLDFISSAKAYVAAGQNYNYAHNVTIDGCTFTAAEGSDVVGIRGWQDFNVVVKNCVMNGGHSLAQITASSDTVFESCTINAGRGLNLLTSCVGLVVANCDITATEADGYGIRCDAGVASCLNLSGSTINAYEPVVLRNSKATFVFDVATTTLNATGEYQVVVKGVKPVMNGAEAYTCNM